MKMILAIIQKELAEGFARAGYDEKYAIVTVSNRPDLCEYQCNGAMAAKKEYGKAPREIAQEVANALSGSQVFSEVSVAGPGFINLKIADEKLAEYLSIMAEDPEISISEVYAKRKILIDYGGPNVAKPLHVGHLRSAIIGESLKRMGRRLGHEVLGDIHLGDWGLQMGLIMTELQERKPELPYFDDSFTGEYPAEAPFTIGELEEIYPAASARSKEDDEYRARALEATHMLQEGKRGYRALWQHIINVSVSDLKKNYEKLNVSFDLWKSESDAQPYIPDMVQKMKDDGFAYMDQGALVVDVAKDDDTKEVPPCILLKSDGASLYTTTDLATLVERMKLFAPDEVLYVVDKRQEMHFEQVFRCARKTGIVPENVRLSFLGFGTMNGKDGKPFKTREGGVMRLETLIADINQEMYQKIVENRSVRDKDADDTAKIVGLSALKYGDLSNQASKDYIFDIDRFTSFEGNTGPYILYTIVRIKSILNRYQEELAAGTGNTAAESSAAEAGAGNTAAESSAAEAGMGNAGAENSAAEAGTVDAAAQSFAAILPAASDVEKTLQLQLARYNEAYMGAFSDRAPHRLCAYIYELSNNFNSFYHATKILSEENLEQKRAWISLLELTRKVLEDAIDGLGFSAPERM